MNRYIQSILISLSFLSLSAQAEIDLSKSYQLSPEEITAQFQQESQAFYSQKNANSCLRQALNVVFKSSCIDKENKTDIAQLFTLYLLSDMPRTLADLDSEAGGDNIIKAHLQIKNALSYQYIQKTFAEDIKNQKASAAFSAAVNNLRILTGENGLWKNPTQVLFKFQDKYIQRPISASLKDKQALMTYISNGTTTTALNYGYLLMKNSVDTHLSKNYGQVFYFLDSNKHDSDSMSIKDRFDATLLKLQQNPYIENIDFYWQAHSTDVPMQSTNNMSIGNITKVRFVNNTWCDGIADFTGDTSYIPRYAKYVLASRGINNPYPFNFALNFFLGLNLPEELSESLARVVHLKFYQNVFNQLEFGPSKNYAGIEESGRYELKNMLYLYSSWFDHFGDGSFSLADPLFPAGDKNQDVLSSNTAWPVYDQSKEKREKNSDPETPPADSKFLGLQKIAIDKLLTVTNGVTDLKGDDFNQVLKTVGLDALNFTSTLFMAHTRQNDLFGGWNRYYLNDDTVAGFREIAKTQLSGSEPYYAFLSYLITQTTGLEYLVNDAQDQLILNLKFATDLRGRSKLLSDATKGMLTGLEIQKNVQIILSFRGRDELGLFIRGVNVSGPAVNSLSFPEVVINHRNGTLQLLHDGLPTIDLLTSASLAMGKSSKGMEPTTSIANPAPVPTPTPPRVTAPAPLGPKFYEIFESTNATLESPSSRVLTAGGSQHFSLKVPGAEKAYIISGPSTNRTWTALQKDGDHFQGDAPIFAGDVFVAAHFPTNTGSSVSYLIQYIGQ